MNVAIFTDDALNRKHGTGAQVIRTFFRPDGTAEQPLLHFYRLDSHGRSDYQPSVLMRDSELLWRLPKGKRFLERALYKTGRRWGTSDRPELSLSLFKAALRQHNFRPDVAYVIVYSEEGARSILPLTRAMGCPYVVHIMDLMHPEGLNPTVMPGFHELLSAAHSVLCITPTIREEVVKFPVRETSLVFIGQEMTSHQAIAPKAGEPLRVVMVGNPYQQGMEMLADALPLLKNGVAGRLVELSYIGAAYSRLPKRLQEQVKEVGMISDREQYQRLIAKSHVAYLCGPSEMNHMARYSFPSRTSDYLAAGLPVTACLVPDSATAQILSPLMPSAVRPAKTPEDIAEAFTSFAESPDIWQLASRRSRAFAEEKMNISRIRLQIWDALAEAARMKSASSQTEEQSISTHNA